ncbi:hypothetical protein F5Y06DRAFT_98737 [Hypoxylon sp. FL0890]|nr:hypothetical protein F5Y06DRAFT_98737 [Hypoxylon sp. FL0890]
MATSITTFHAFPRLPTEVQSRIWQAFILITNKERLVMLDEESREIIPTRFLAYSPFCVNFLTRKLFMELYPDQIPVFRTYTQATFADDNSEDGSLDYDYTVEDEEDDNSASSVDDLFSDYCGEPCGYIYVNFSLDTFIVSGIQRRSYDFDEDRFRPLNYAITSNHKTPPFRPDQCQRMKHLMEVTIFQKWRAKKPVPRICDLAKLNKHRYAKKVFSGVETCQHLYWFTDVDDDAYELFGDEHFDLQIDLLTLPGCDLLDKWAQEAVLFDEKMLQKKPKKLTNK